MIHESTSLHNRPAGVKNGLLWLGAGLWIVLVAAGMGLMHRYENTPGDSGQSPVEWPAASPLRRVPAQATLVMFAHPKCPCTRASLDDLAALLAGSDGRVSAYVLFLKPEKTGDDWKQTELWKMATAIPGVTVSADEAGTEAARFGGETSGDVLLYDAHGRLAFHGGITAARGQVGENAGLAALNTLLAGNQPAQTRTPVFGCPLTASSCALPSNP